MHVKLSMMTKKISEHRIQCVSSVEMSMEIILEKLDMPVSNKCLVCNFQLKARRLLRFDNMIIRNKVNKDGRV